MTKGKPAQLAGQRFGFWKVLRKADTYKSGSVHWVCQCTFEGCGAIHEILTGNLTQGKSTCCRSCGAKQGQRSRYRKAKEK